MCCLRSGKRNSLNRWQPSAVATVNFAGEMSCCLRRCIVPSERLISCNCSIVRSLLMSSLACFVVASLQDASSSRASALFVVVFITKSISIVVYTFGGVPGGCWYKLLFVFTFGVVKFSDAVRFGLPVGLRASGSVSSSRSSPDGNSPWPSKPWRLGVPVPPGRCHRISRVIGISGLLSSECSSFFEIFRNL